jgi:hypothetical protein
MKSQAGSGLILSGPGWKLVVAPDIPPICSKKFEAGNKTVKGFHFASISIAGACFVVPFGGPKIIWKYKATNKVITGGIPYIKSYGERIMPSDLPKLVREESDHEDPEPSPVILAPIQRGNRPETIDAFTKIILN